MALVKMEGTWPGGGEGVGAALHGSRPSYVDVASGFSSTKLPPKLEEMPYACVGLGALNIVVEGQEKDKGLKAGAKPSNNYFRRTRSVFRGQGIVWNLERNGATYSDKIKQKKRDKTLCTIDSTIDRQYRLKSKPIPCLSSTYNFPRVHAISYGFAAK